MSFDAKLLLESIIKQILVKEFIFEDRYLKNIKKKITNFIS